LATGLGAACADATYGVLVAAGLAASGLLVRYAGPMALGGGVLIAWLGLMTLRAGYRRPPSEMPVGQATSHAGVVAAWGTTYLLTLSNPMTIIAFVGMIAALGTAASGTALAPYWLVLGVFLGSALWWLLLVHFALVVRRWMTAGALRGLDFAVGALLLLWGLWIALGAYQGMSGAI
jgi:threonine/homoserine/homoserine lactone efflux protein